MSYSTVIRDCIFDSVSKYNNEISKKFGIPIDDLMNIFFNNEVENEENKVEDKKVEDNKEDRQKELSKKSKKDLQEMCKQLSINEKGSKKELIERLIRGKKETIIDKIQTTITSIIIKKNRFDNYEHEPTSFVFNKNTKCVIGKQSDNGDIIQLDDDDFEICKQYKFKFKIPETISTKVVNYEDEDIIEDEDDEDDEENENDIEDN